MSAATPSTANAETSIVFFIRLGDWIALMNSVEQVALEAGKSPGIIFKHYRELATEEKARDWFSVESKVR